MMTIDTSKLKALYINGKKVASLSLNGKKLKLSGGSESGYLTVTALEAPCTVTISKTGSPTAAIEYSTDGSTWTAYEYNTDISLASVGSKVMFRASSLNSTFSVDWNNYYRLNASAKYRLSGDIMSLLDPQLTTDVVPNNCFARLFRDSTTLSSVEGLKIGAKTIEIDGFNEAFYGCTSLVDASGFDISGIENVSGGGMWGFFQRCTSLIASPMLPNLTATRWDARTYFFRECSHLSSISTLQTTWGDDDGGAYWIESVPKTDKQKFFCPSALGTDSTIQRGDTHRCPSNWLVGNLDVDGSLMSNAFTRGSYTTAYVYDGNNHMPSMADISVHNGHTTELLVNGSDYDIVEPEDMSSIGTKTLTFTGMGTYTGSFTRTYKIVDGDISRCTIELGTAYDNEGPTTIKVWSNDLQQYLTEDTDFTWTYYNSDDTCTVTVEGIGNWHGTKTATVARKDSGTTPLAVYKHDSNDSNNVYVKLASFQGGPDVLIDKKPMSDPTASWSQLGTSYASDSVGFWLRARNQNERMGRSDWEYKWIDCGYDQNNAAQVDLSGDIASLLDRSQTSLSSTLQSSVLNSTFQNNDKIVDASKLSCSMKSFDSGFGIRRLFGSRNSGTGAMSGRPQALTAMPMLEGLSVNTRNGYAYIANFQGCTSLSSAVWQIPWAINPYNNWDGSNYIGEQEFRDCTQLRDVVISSHFGDGRLCEDSLMSQAKFLRETFQGCSNLTCISTDLSAWPANGFPNWVSGVAATGTFICPEALGTDATIQRGNNYCPTGWTVVNYDAAPVPLKFTAEQSNSTVALSAFYNAPAVSLLSSTDGETWTSYTVNDTVTLANVGDYVMFKADQPNSGFASSDADHNRFVMTGKIAASGSIMSLLDGEQKTSTVSSERCFHNLFAVCTSLTQAPELPATELCSSCYRYMFQGCTSLATAPVLPATTLADNCYRSMFSGCTSLSAAPELSATTLASYCYYYMFDGCTSLSNAPSLPATELSDYCYYQMFNGCSSLSSMDVKFTAWSPSNATQNWLSGVAATGTFKCPADLDTTLSDDSHIPAGWTVVQPTVQYVDYVQTNSYALDTLYKPTVNTSLSTCLSGNANGNCFIGFNYDNDQQDYRLFNLHNWLYFDMGDGRINTTNGWDTSKWTDISAWNYGFKFTPEGGSEYSTTGTAHSTADWDANGTINIAGFSTSTGQRDICIKGLKIYESEVLVRDFKAAVDANDVAGLYDEVQGVFYYPTGGAWTAHGIVPPTPPTPTDPYATFSGQQYIMTDFKPDQDTRVVMDVDVANTKEYWFGAWNTAYNMGAFAAGNDDNGVYIGYDHQGGTLAPLVSNGRHTVEMDKNAWKVDGTAVHTFNYTTLSVNYDLVLFGQNRAGYVHIPSKSNIVKLYSAKIYDNGTLVRDFAPSTDSLGAEGLYESIESIFYYKDGTSQQVTPPDTDGYGWTDAEETEAGSDPTNPDSTPDDIDGDGFDNSTEQSYGSDPDDPYSTPETVGTDSDGDGYTDYEEDQAGTAPDDPEDHPGSDDDSDGDGWSDHDEDVYGTDSSDPNDSPDTHDTDEDGYTDGDEINNGTDPFDPDDYHGVEPDPEEEPEEEPEE